jgi:4-hydroxy-2-oxoheptanedioate aldolase
MAKKQARRALRDKLRSGQAVVGVIMKIPSPDMAELLGYSGLDLLVADAEHGPIAPETCQQLVRAVAASDSEMELLVRVPSLDPTVILRYVDTGIGGVQLPHVWNGRQAEDAIGAVFHPPLGARGLAGGRWADYGFREPLLERIHQSAESLVIVAQLEDKALLNHIPEVIGIARIDVFYIGPVDLAASMGHTGNSDHPEVQAAVKRLFDEATAAGLTVGTIAKNADDCAQKLAAGYRFVLVNAENAFLEGPRRLAELRRAQP